MCREHAAALRMAPILLTRGDLDRFQMPTMPDDLLDPTICARIAGHGQIKLSVSSVALLGFTPGLIVLRTTKVQVAGPLLSSPSAPIQKPPLESYTAFGLDAWDQVDHTAASPCGLRYRRLRASEG